MNVEECPSFEKCEAPLCPLYEDNKYSVWYPDEDICNKIGRPAWVKIQRKIKKRVIDRDSHYTIEMIESIGRVTPKTRGLDPEGRRTEEVFLARKAKARNLTTMGMFAQNTPFNKAIKGYNPHDMPKTTQARMFS